MKSIISFFTQEINWYDPPSISEFQNWRDNRGGEAVLKELRNKNPLLILSENLESKYLYIVNESIILADFLLKEYYNNLVTNLGIGVIKDFSEKFSEKIILESNAVKYIEILDRFLSINESCSQLLLTRYLAVINDKKIVIVRMLEKHGASINWKNKQGNTYFHVFPENSYFLASAGGDPTIKNNENEDGIMCLIESTEDFKSVFDLLNSPFVKNTSIYHKLLLSKRTGYLDKCIKMCEE